MKIGWVHKPFLPQQYVDVVFDKDLLNRYLESYHQSVNPGENHDRMQNKVYHSCLYILNSNQPNPKYTLLANWGISQ